MDLYNLANSPEHIPTLARWFHNQWGYLSPDRTEQQIVTELTTHNDPNKIPITLILQEDNKPIATAALLVHDMDTHKHLTPWLASVYVPEEYRKRGLGKRIVGEVSRYAKQLGLDHLYLFTPDKELWYKKMGWTTQESPEYHGHPVTLMETRL